MLKLWLYTVSATTFGVESLDFYSQEYPLCILEGPLDNTLSDDIDHPGTRDPNSAVPPVSFAKLEGAY